MTEHDLQPASTHVGAPSSIMHVKNSGADAEQQHSLEQMTCPASKFALGQAFQTLKFETQHWNQHRHCPWPSAATALASVLHFHLQWHAQGHAATCQLALGVNAAAAAVQVPVVTIAAATLLIGHSGSQHRPESAQTVSASSRPVIVFTLAR